MMQKNTITVTSDKITQPLTFAFAADFHNGDADEALSLMRGCDAILIGGDLVNRHSRHGWRNAARFLDLAKRHPAAVVCGNPLYDASVPKARLIGRYATQVWVWINTLSFAIRDSMCGFRVYPLPPAVRLLDEEHIGRRMDFDSEILVRLAWRGLETINLPTPVTYPADGVSHFDVLRDNLRITRMHTRLFFGMLRRLPRLLRRKFAA